jgi:chromate reductase, NAD(P)H dehydrogenase (quinone)
VNLFAISGSLRADSSNTRLLRALAILAPDTVAVSLYDGLDGLPHFNPDLDIEPAPPPVAEFRAQLQAADVIVISSPEYAHGVPGTLKNALDWVVSSGEFVKKPVALMNASQRATHAYESLAETLRTMSAAIIPEASVTIPLLGVKLESEKIAAHPEFSRLLRGAQEAIERHSTPVPVRS